MANYLARFEAFVRRERERFAVRHNNMFAFAFGEIDRYYRFLRLVYRRHRIVERSLTKYSKDRQASASASPPGSHPMTGQEIRLFRRGMSLSLRHQLEIESFYQFAKIMLDKVARALEFYFGQVPKRPLDSHDDLVKNLEAYASTKGLRVPAGLLKMARDLKRDIADFRDYQITHAKSPRTMRGTIFDGKGNVRMTVQKIYPTERDQHVESKALNELLEQIEQYLEAFIAFVQENAAKSNLDLDK